MRNSKQITIDNHAITLNELRPVDVRRIMLLLKEQGLPVDKLMEAGLPYISELLGDCLVLPEGVSLDHIGFAAIQTLVNEFSELNAPFLSSAAQLGIVIPWPNLISLAVSSSSAAISTPVNTAGDFSAVP
ncbi:MAG: hypothetical protein EPN21_13225 [Methylococcaceae bacterium]|nr:MAG: hypothetical protein EPN21_13225 [Methylococcaceae bacterium]